MKNLVVVLVASAVAASGANAAQGVAPAVKRKPAAAAPAPAPAAPRQEPVAATAPVAPPSDIPLIAPLTVPPAPVAKSPAPVAPRPAASAANEREIQAALTAVAAEAGGDPALDTSLIKVMTRLVGARRCSEAAGLAAQNGRTMLARRAAQLCK